jgi:hypothetical protein
MNINVSANTNLNTSIRWRTDCIFFEIVQDHDRIAALMRGIDFILFQWCGNLNRLNIIFDRKECFKIFDIVFDYGSFFIFTY